MSGHFFVGVDGGATSCRARIRDMDGDLLGEGESGPANIHSDPRLAIKSIHEATAAALRAAGLAQSCLQTAHAGLGLAGAGIKDACKQLLAAPTGFASIELETDAYVAWLGAHQGEDGGITILGTGSCGLAIFGGRRVMVAGWGPQISDEAGGQRMGREALRRSLWAYDGRAEQSDLTKAMLNRFEWDPAKAVSFASKASAADYAKFAPLIFHYASAQDPVAVALVEEAAAAAGKIIERLLSVGAPIVSLIGGLAEPLMRWLPRDLCSHLRTPKSDPADGAILMARRAFFKLDSVTLKAG